MESESELPESSPTQRLWQAVVERRSLRYRDSDLRKIELAIQTDAQSSTPIFEKATLLGYGGFGAVYECTWRQMNRRVAVKFLRPRLKDKMSTVFESASKAMGRVHHQNFAQVYLYGVLYDVPYCIMDLIPNAGQLDGLRGTYLEHCFSQRSSPEGNSVSRENRDRSWTPKVAYAFYRFAAERFSHVADVLTLLHEGVRDNHGDLYPRNFLIQRYVSPQTDRDAAQADDKQDTAVLTVGGTSIAKVHLIDAMGVPEKGDEPSPKLPVGPRPIGQDDIRNFCIAMCTALFSDFLHFGPTLPGVPRKVSPDVLTNSEIIGQSLIPAPLLRILNMGVTPEPKYRYRTARELAEDLRLFSQLRPLMWATPRRLLNRMWETAVLWARRSPIQPLLIAATVLALVITSIAWYRSENFRSISDTLLQNEKKLRMRAERAEDEAQTNLVSLQNSQRREQLAREARELADRHDSETTRITLGNLRATTEGMERLAGAAPRNAGGHAAEVDFLLEQWRTFAKHHTDDVHGKLNLAEGLERVGAIWSKLGYSERAIDLQRECVAVLDALPANIRNESFCHLRKVSVLCSLGHAYRNEGSGELAESAFKASLQSLFASEKHHPKSLQFSVDEMALHLNIGLVHLMQNKHDSAESQFSECGTIYRSLSDIDANNPKAEGIMSLVFSNWGVLLIRQGDYHGAIIPLEAAVNIIDRIVQLEESSETRKYEQAVVHENIAIALANMDRVDEAMEHFNLATNILYQLTNNHPSTPAYAYRLASNLYAQAEIGFEREENLSHFYDESIRLMRDLLRTYPNVIEYEVLLAQSYVGFGTVSGIDTEIELGIRGMRSVSERLPESAEHRELLIHYLVLLAEMYIRSNDGNEKAATLLKEAIEESVEAKALLDGRDFYMATMGRCYAAFGKYQIYKWQYNDSRQSLATARYYLSKTSEKSNFACVRNSRARSLISLSSSYLTIGLADESESVWREANEEISPSFAISAILQRVEELVKAQMIEAAIVELKRTPRIRLDYHGLYALKRDELFQTAKVMSLLSGSVCQGMEEYQNISMDALCLYLLRGPCGACGAEDIAKVAEFRPISARREFQELLAGKMRFASSYELSPSEPTPIDADSAKDGSTSPGSQVSEPYNPPARPES